MTGGGAGSCALDLKSEPHPSLWCIGTSRMSPVLTHQLSVVHLQPGTQQHTKFLRSGSLCFRGCDTQ